MFSFELISDGEYDWFYLWDRLSDQKYETRSIRNRVNEIYSVELCLSMKYELKRSATQLPDVVRLGSCGKKRFEGHDLLGLSCGCITEFFIQNEAFLNNTK